MFTKIYNYLFKNKPQIEDEQMWINIKINEWKVEKFTNNSYLNYIPNDLIIKKKLELRREYKNLKNRY